MDIPLWQLLIVAYLSLSLFLVLTYSFVRWAIRVSRGQHWCRHCANWTNHDTWHH